MRRHFLSELVCWAAWGSAACVASSAWAQSSYTLTKLSPPSGGMIEPSDNLTQRRLVGIDPQGNVIGGARFAAGWYFDSNPPYLRKRNDQHVVRWPASTAASVSPTKLLKAADWSFMQLDVSSSASKVMVYSKTQAVFDVATLKLGAALPTISNQRDALYVNDGAEVLWLARGTLGDVGVLSASGVSQPLPTIEASGLAGRWLNNKGEVAGHVQVAGEQLTRAAVWSKGQITVVDQRPNAGSKAVMSNDVGHIVIQDQRWVCYTARCAPEPASVGVLYNGVYQPIQAPGSTNPWAIQVRNMNNMGQVVGFMSEDDVTNGRGFLWKDGKYTDVTSWLSTKGVVLPLGSRIRNVLAINDAGAMVAEVVAADQQTTTLVRLTPKP